MSPVVEKVLANVRVLEDLPDASAIDADLAAFREILKRLRDIDPSDAESFEKIVDDLDAAIDEHATEQSRAQEALENATGAGSEALEWMEELDSQFARAEFEAAWAEVDRARSMMAPPFNPRLDCRACHRGSLGLAASDVAHDEQCPNRPARVPAPRPTPAPARVAIDPATGLPPRPQTRGEVMGRLYSLSERRPASVPCTKCRTGAGKRHGKGCTNAGARAR